MNFEEMTEQFAAKHPALFWMLVRLIICFCWLFVVVLGFVAFVVAIAPFFAVFNGSGASAFFLWMLIPVLIVACWALGNAAIWLYENFVE